MRNRRRKSGIKLKTFIARDTQILSPLVQCFCCRVYKAHTPFHICTLEECGDCATVEGSWFSRSLMLPLVSHLPLSTDILSAWNLFSSPGLVTTWPQDVCVSLCECVWVRDKKRQNSCTGGRKNSENRLKKSLHISWIQLLRFKIIWVYREPKWNRTSVFCSKIRKPHWKSHLHL